MKHFLVCLVSCFLWTCCASQSVCEEPPDIDFGEVVSGEKVSYQENDRIQYRCSPGYALEGSEWIICNDQKWTLPPKCLAPCSITRQQLDAKNLLTSNGQRRSQLIWSNYSIAFMCREGYVITTPSVRKCVDGHMDLPSCISERGKNCSRPPIIENGDFITLLQKQYPSGSWVEFKCQLYYAMEGQNKSFCDNGIWTKVPACLEPCVITLAESHMLVKERSHGSEFLTTYLPRGDSLELSCKPGYVLETNPSQSAFLIQCNEEPIVYPKCKEIVCSPPEVGNGHFAPRLSLYRNEDEVHIQCDDGYRLEHRGDSSKCTENGWSPAPQCIEKPCDASTVKNGRLRDSYRLYLDYNFPRKVGQTVDYLCNGGFLSISHKQYWGRSTCRDFGWDPKPHCSKQCSPPDSLPHGSLIYNYWTKYIEENEISFSCNEGYYPASPEAKSKCTKDGWAPFPRCIEIVTCRITHPPNGYFHQHIRVFALHEKTTYGCHNGYTTPKGLDRGETQCLEEGWTPKPECIQTCQKPPERNMKFINATKSVFLYMEKLVYECPDGYETSNQATGDHTVCTEKGWNPKPECQRIQCYIPTLENGRITPNKDKHFEGDVVKFGCQRPYIRAGTGSSQCYHFGWSPPPPICKEQVNPCSAPPGISDGRTTNKLLEEYPHGAQVDYECNDQFAMVGSSKIECVDGEWTALPSCTEEDKTCGPPPNITNGHPVSEDGDRYFHGDTMSYRCAENTFSVGPYPAKCLHGEWELPSCVDDRTICAPPKLPNSPLPDPQIQYKNNTIISYNCGSDRQITKCVNGKWSPEPQCKGPCPPPPQLPNAIIQLKNIGNVEKIRFKCKEHFKLQGPQEIACENGKWQRPPHCLDQRCGDPPAIEHGDVKGNKTEKYPPGRPVEYQCHEGFEISETRFVTCSNRKWSQPPTCNEKPCGDPPIVPNSSILEKIKATYHAGETVTYECHPGFGADGPLTVTCRRGEWTEPPNCEDKTCQEHPAVDNADVLMGAGAPYLPGHQVQYQCQEGFDISGSDIITCENKTWSKPPVCKDATCPRPPTISHGYLDGQPKERYLPFEKVRYRCEGRWSLFGPQSVTCMNKQWTDLPECREAGGKCDRPPVIQNGDILEAIKFRYESNSVVTYKCQALHIMHGHPTVQCFNGHWTEAPKCIAPCTVSEEDMRNHNIQLRWSRDEKLYSESGDVMEFMCRYGFEPAPSSSPFRIYCREGKLEYPSCTKFCTVNVQTMRNRNIQLKRTSETRIPFGDEVEFICKQGFQAVSTSSSFQVQCEEGNLEYPRCRRTNG